MRMLLPPLLAVALLAPTSGAAQMPPDTFEIVFPAHGPRPVAAGEAIRIAADALDVPPVYGLIELRRGPNVVAIFQMHQVMFLANRSVRGARTFTIHAADRTYTISADRMHAGQNNAPIVFWVGDRPVGAVNPNSVSMVTDSASVLEPGG